MYEDHGKKEGTPFNEPLSPGELNERIKRIESRPDKLIRREGYYNDLQGDNLDAVIHEFNASKREFERMNREYGIAIPQMDFILGRSEKHEGGDIVMYIIVDKIFGKELAKINKFPDEAEVEVDTFYANLVRYHDDAHKNGGSFWTDCREDQFMYGHKDKETKDHIYLADVEPHLEDSRTEDFILYRLMGILSDIQNAESKFSRPVTFTRARSALKDALNGFQGEKWEKDHRITEAMQKLERGNDE